MDYEPAPSDNSDTDEDLPPHQSRVPRPPHISVNGNSMLGSGAHRRVQGDMEHQINHLEKEAYFSVLRAFKAQSDAITWEKEGLITELRKELRVSDDEHRLVLIRVNNDDTIRRIREWRQGGGHLATSHPINDVSSTTPASRKKQRTSQSVPSHVVPSMTTTVQPSPSGATLGPRGRKPRQFPYSNPGSTGAIAAHESAVPGTGEQLIGRKILTRWPDDNHFYEAEIRQYNASDGRHELVYYTPDESFEWVHLSEIPPDDIRWVGDDRGFPQRGAAGDKKSMNHGAVPGAGRNQYRNEQQNGAGKRTDDIEILHTDTLIKEVERVVAASNPDRLEIEKAKKMLKDHEQALIDAISRLTYVSDGDSDGGQQF